LKRRADLPLRADVGVLDGSALVMMVNDKELILRAHYDWHLITTHKHYLDDQICLYIFIYIYIYRCRQREVEYR